MSRLSKIIHAVNLFCGAGGTSTWLEQACKALRVDGDLVAISHWTTVVNSHAKTTLGRVTCACSEYFELRPSDGLGVVRSLMASWPPKQSPKARHASTTGKSFCRTSQRWGSCLFSNCSAT
jgi:hypothetical protein